MQGLALSAGSEKVLGSVPGLVGRAFCVVFVCLPRVGAGFLHVLQVSPSVHKLTLESVRVCGALIRAWEKTSEQYSNKTAHHLNILVIYIFFYKSVFVCICNFRVTRCCCLLPNYYGKG